MTDPFMRRALDLARGVQGKTSPNPPVGAVIVKQGVIVGEGATQAAGQSHAEVGALHAAGESARDATLYVTLEPCSHWGRTPPCVDAVIAAGVASVHIALPDPNPLVNGRGIKKLEGAGVDVSLGAGASEAAELVEGHVSLVVRGCPFVTLLVGVPSAVVDDFNRRMDGVYVAEPHLPAQQAVNLFNETLQSIQKQGGSTCVVSGPAGFREALISNNLVDKIVTGVDEPPVQGFRIRRRANTPAPHVVLYPHDPGVDESQGENEDLCLLESSKK